MKLSLVIASVERTQELYDLMEGFATQAFRDFEVFLVDQNSDDRLVPLVEKYKDRFPLTHIRSDVRNASHARNVGLFAAKGELVGFPDDDCLYQSDTMERVIAHFDREPGVALLGGPCIKRSGELANGRWSTVSCEIHEGNVWTTMQGFSMWMRTEAALAVNGFDPAIGPGTPWGSSEEPDLALRLLRRGFRCEYDVTLGVFHPDKTLSPAALVRAHHYGAGMGRVLRRHSIGARIALPYFYRPIGGILVSLLRARTLHARYYWSTLRGRIFGYLAQPAR